ncbi:MAG TPA: alpha/beta hydrolase [Phycisphaerae bacterium]|nr:alpha/beta hydrolase [Phycisphaerae bacterium]
MRSTVLKTLIVLTIALGGAGCEKRGAAEPFGKTFYLGGASNVDVLSSGVPDGLRQAGYRGDVRIFIWTVSFNPLIDQLLTINAKARAALLAEQIQDYRKRYPHNEINVIALSAGTGVAVWALEELDDDTRVDNLVLLGSSLSHDYDVSKALKHMDGRIYVYHSPHDMVLATVRVVGTIDGKRGVDSVGQVGLAVPPGADDRIRNVEWSRQYMRYGWAGGHTDCTNTTFVREVIAPLITNEPAATVAARTGRSSGGHITATP